MAEKSKYQDIDAVDAALDKGVAAKDAVGDSTTGLTKQVTDLEQEVGDVKDSIESTEIVKTTWTSGKIGSDGVTATESNSEYCDFVELIENAVYSITTKSANSWFYAFYTSASESGFLSATALPMSASTAVLNTITPPSGAKYMRVTRFKSLGDLNVSYLTNIQSRIESAETEIEEISEQTISSKSVSATISTTWTSGKIGSNGASATDSNAEYSDFVALLEGFVYTITTKSTNAWFYAFYTSASESDFLSATALPSSVSTAVLNTITPPSGAKYMRVTRFKSVGDLAASGTLKKSNVGKAVRSFEEVGNYDFPTLFDADLCYIPAYGQSYTVTPDGGYMVTDVSEYGSHVWCHNKYGNLGAAWISNLKNLDGTPMSGSSSYSAISIENTIADFAMVLHNLIKKYCYKIQDILVSSYGTGSRSCWELSKDNGMNPDDTTLHQYENVFEPGLALAKQAADNEGKTISCPLILFLQGESDCKEERYDPEGSATEAISALADKDTYKTHFLRIKEQMQASVMEATGQTKKPAVFIYCACNQTFNSKACGIPQACLELAQENEDVFCVGGYYQMPTYTAHLTPDGRRWLGELFAKCVFETFVQGKVSTIEPISHEVKGNKLKIYFRVPYAPLQIDTYTVPQKSNYGFDLFVYDSETKTRTAVPIYDVDVNGNEVTITSGEDLSEIENLYVTYANTTCSGYGNVRDSGKWGSMCKYDTNDLGNMTTMNQKPLDEDGNEITGLKYPMQSWMPPFGFSVN